MGAVSRARSSSNLEIDVFQISKDFTFSAAHSIRGHQGGCERLHGHNYRVRIHLASEQLNELGMVMDFADLKKVADDILTPFDHQVINDIPPFTELNTTAELFAEYVFQQVQLRIKGEQAEVVKVEVWENERSGASFQQEDAI